VQCSQTILQTVTIQTRKVASHRFKLFLSAHSLKNELIVVAKEVRISIWNESEGVDGGTKVF